MTAWSPSSWQQHPAQQQPEWPDAAELEASLQQIAAMPPLVFAGEARSLKQALAEAAAGRAFVLQAGDCAEAFGDFSADAIRDKLKIILQMAVVLTYASGLPTIKLGRIAGQFAKPRSSSEEEVGGVALPTFRGHAVNDVAFEVNSRLPDPSRLLRAYHQSAATLNLIRALTKGGYADLKQIHTWNQEFVAHSPQGRRYEAIARHIDQALRFMAACGIDLSADSHLHQVDFYISHEALLLGYEQALTRQDSLTGDFYCCSAHLLWVGERTRQPQGAHVEYLSGVRNPIGCKLGPTATASEVLELCERLDPRREPGRLSLITRMGAGRLQEVLPGLLEAVAGSGHRVVWICDPMHANTFTTASGIKTRRFSDILAEIKAFFAVHRAAGTHPGGVHLELTHEDVTECLGGAEEVSDLSSRYRALCDPVLNARQSLELAFEISELLQEA